jgi:hypothetical protein
MAVGGNKPVRAELPSVEPSERDQFAINTFFQKRVFIINIESLKPLLLCLIFKIKQKQVYFTVSC